MSCKANIETRMDLSDYDPLNSDQEVSQDDQDDMPQQVVVQEKEEEEEEGKMEEEEENDNFYSSQMDPTNIISPKKQSYGYPKNTTTQINHDAKNIKVKLSQGYEEYLKEPSQSEQQNEIEDPSEMCFNNSLQENTNGIRNPQQEASNFQQLSQSEQQKEKEVSSEMGSANSLQENTNQQFQRQSNEQTMTDGIQYIFHLLSQYNGIKIILMKGADLKCLESIRQQYEIIHKYESGVQYNGSKIILMIADLKSLQSFLQQYEITCKYESGVQYIFLLKSKYNGSKIIQMRADLKSSESIVQQYQESQTKMIHIIMERIYIIFFLFLYALYLFQLSIIFFYAQNKSKYVVQF